VIERDEDMGVIKLLGLKLPARVVTQRDRTRKKKKEQGKERRRAFRTFLTWGGVRRLSWK